MAQRALGDRPPTLPRVFILHLRTTGAHNLCLHMALLLPAAAVHHQRVTQVDDFAESHKEPLDINNLLLRGSVLRKTPWVIGVAINVGNDSKIVQNMTKAPRKVSSVCFFGGSVRCFGLLLACMCVAPLDCLAAALDGWCLIPCMCFGFLLCRSHSWSGP